MEGNAVLNHSKQVLLVILQLSRLLSGRVELSELLLGPHQLHDRGRLLLVLQHRRRHLRDTLVRMQRLQMSDGTLDLVQLVLRADTVGHAACGLLLVV